MYYIFFRNTKGRLCSTIHSKPLTTISIQTGNIDKHCKTGDTMEVVNVPCKHIDLSKYQ